MNALPRIVSTFGRTLLLVLAAAIASAAVPGALAAVDSSAGSKAAERPAIPRDAQALIDRSCRLARRVGGGRAAAGSRAVGEARGLGTLGEPHAACPPRRAIAARVRPGSDRGRRGGDRRRRLGAQCQRPDRADGGRTRSTRLRRENGPRVPASPARRWRRGDARRAVREGGPRRAALRFTFPDGDHYDLLVDPRTGESVWSRAVTDGRETWTQTLRLPRGGGRCASPTSRRPSASRPPRTRSSPGTRSRQHRPGRQTSSRDRARPPASRASTAAPP